MLRLPSAWTWDFWLADDGELFHLFFLKASRALIDPDRRHRRAGIGHAVSFDLRSWTEVADALVAADGPAFDDLATWTGSVVRGDDGRWRLFYTGVDRSSDGATQRIGVAVSDDLYTWTRTSDVALLEADPLWYEKFAEDSWPDEAWRDPWVLRDPAGNGWHMLITARAATGALDERGVIGHATSGDLEHWTVQSPLSEPGSGFGQLEVPQVETVGDRNVLIFSCMTSELSSERRDSGETGGVWALNTGTLTGPFDVSSAYRITDETYYAGRLVQDQAGTWWLLAFLHTAPDGSFVGQLSDPMPVQWGDDGRLWAGQQASASAWAD
ncbi:glycosyl hydrolase family 32 [Pengzhenrongella sp.]|jgi:beta-fructofuranosidase|uniref:glycosyl hydrolase family 32 n=1 Tax=Pengzhenrongella sp. TaxID=2888820 RepID=UPI002F937DAA